MTTPTPIETFEDILAAMENNPRLQAALRQHVLDQEFLQLPAIVREIQQALAQLTQLVHDYIAATDARLDRLEAGQARLESDVAELKAGQARLEGDVAELKTGQARLEGDVAELKTGQVRLEGDVAELKAGQHRLEGQFNQFRGDNYEARVQSQAMSYAIIQLGFLNPYVSRPVNAGNAPQFNSALQRAISDGSISRDQAMDLCNADLIISGDENRHLVAEISITVSATDIERAVRRAGIMRTATDGVCTPAIISQNVPPSQSAEAEANGVAAMLFT